MSSALSQKLRVKENSTLLTINAPDSFKKTLHDLPAGVSIRETAKTYDQVHWFVRDRKQMEKQLRDVLALLKENIIVWVYFPKSSSGIQTDLTRDKGWDCLLDESEKISWIGLVSFDATWSVFGFRAKTGADKKKEARPTVREVFNWVDPVSKTVTLPPDLLTAFKKNQKEAARFDTLSFTNKKEYIEWIVTAKRDDTRKVRVAGTIERLAKGWKNPRNL